MGQTQTRKYVSSRDVDDDGGPESSRSSRGGYGGGGGGGGETLSTSESSYSCSCSGSCTNNSITSTSSEEDEEDDAGCCASSSPKRKPLVSGTATGTGSGSASSPTAGASSSGSRGGTKAAAVSRDRKSKEKIKDWPPEQVVATTDEGEAIITGHSEEQFHNKGYFDQRKDNRTTQGTECTAKPNVQAIPSSPEHKASPPQAANSPIQNPSSPPSELGSAHTPASTHLVQSDLTLPNPTPTPNSPHTTPSKPLIDLTTTTITVAVSSPIHNTPHIITPDNSTTVSPIAPTVLPIVTIEPTSQIPDTNPKPSEVTAPEAKHLEVNALETSAVEANLPELAEKLPEPLVKLPEVTTAETKLPEQTVTVTVPVPVTETKLPSVLVSETNNEPGSSIMPDKANPSQCEALPKLPEATEPETPATAGNEGAASSTISVPLEAPKPTEQVPTKSAEPTSQTIDTPQPESTPPPEPVPITTPTQEQTAAPIPEQIIAPSPEQLMQTIAQDSTQIASLLAQMPLKEKHKHTRYHSLKTKKTKHDGPMSAGSSQTLPLPSRHKKSSSTSDKTSPSSSSSSASASASAHKKAVDIPDWVGTMVKESQAKPPPLFHLRAAKGGKPATGSMTTSLLATSTRSPALPQDTASLSVSTPVADISTQQATGETMMVSAM
ncbi:hypothetical protein Pelo_10641 [Pelomyxa schiedti]|nr:hypothetical protein Pelo_10641 [Pelomyxa schiedti]